MSFGELVIAAKPTQIPIFLIYQRQMKMIKAFPSPCNPHHYSLWGGGKRDRCIHFFPNPGVPSTIKYKLLPWFVPTKNASSNACKQLFPCPPATRNGRPQNFTPPLVFCLATEHRRAFCSSFSQVREQVPIVSCRQVTETLVRSLAYGHLG